MPKPLVIPHPDKELLAQAAASRIINVLAQALAQQELAHISLTGGSMGIASLAAVAQHPLRATVDWSRVHFWWSDERFVASGHPDRNEQQAQDALLASLGLAAEQVHRMGSASDFASADQAAAAYARELAAWAPAGEVSPLFALTLLGMGPDGHIASLFPDRDEVLEAQAPTLPIEDSPKPPPTRVTLTLPVINYSERIYFLIAGADKAEATGRLRAAAVLGEQELTAQLLRQTPAAGARGLLETLILADQTALS